MANIKSAKKRIRVTQKKTLVNKMRKSNLKSAIKRFETMLEEGNIDQAEGQLREVQKKLYKTASKGVIHRNAAARKLSRLTRRFNNAK